MRMSLHFDSKLHSKGTLADYTIDLWKTKVFVFNNKNLCE